MCVYFKNKIVLTVGKDRIGEGGMGMGGHIGCLFVFSFFFVFFLFLTGNKNRLPRQFVKRSNKIRNEKNLVTSF